MLMSWPWSGPRATATTRPPLGLHSLFTSEPICNKGPWVGISDIEIAVAEYIDWFHHRRLAGEIGHIPPAARGQPLR